MIQQDGRYIVAGGLRAYRTDIVSHHRHTIYDTGFLILADCKGALLAHLQETLRAVAAHAGHDDSDFFNGNIFGNGIEKYIHRGTMAADLWAGVTLYDIITA